MKKVAFISLLLILGFSFSISAQSSTKKINKTQKNQQKKIKQGVRSGELTNKEVYKLEKQQAHIQKTKLKAKSDGQVTQNERYEIRKKQAKATNNIAKQKHDKQSK